MSSALISSKDARRTAVRLGYDQNLDAWYVPLRPLLNETRLGASTNRDVPSYRTESVQGHEACCHERVRCSVADCDDVFSTTSLGLSMHKNARCPHERHPMPLTTQYKKLQYHSQCGFGSNGRERHHASLSQEEGRLTVGTTHVGTCRCLWGRQ